MKIKPFEERISISKNDVHENALLNRVYQNRGIESEDDLEYSLAKLISPDKMKGMDKGTDILINHILSDSTIIIVGDYDCDGATSTSIAVEGLKMLGAKNVDFIIPDRVADGYGITRKIVERASERSPDLIITVDNGIAAFEGALAVKDLKKPCQLLITDHHLPAESGEVPDADAIINPSQPGCPFPSKNIAGCGVMFYTILALRKKMREQNIFEKIKIKEPAMSPLLDLVALGTVADVVKLDLNNRILVDAGLAWINKGMCRPGLKKLLEIGKRKIGEIASSDFGFVAGPRINAAGRLDDMTIGIRCLLEKNDSMASNLADRLNTLNESRKEIESNMLETALEFLDDLDINKNSAALYDPSWHEGVVGILASRVKDRTDRPAICFTDTHEIIAAKSKLKRAIDIGITGKELKEIESTVNLFDVKGSARSIPGIHLKHILDEISKKRPDILSKFGGHSMAAGLSVRFDKLEEFRGMFENIISREMTEQMKRGSVVVDIKDIDPSLLTMENADIITSQKIWGQGFEEPVFSQKFDVVSFRVLQEKHLKLSLAIKETGETFDAISFNCVDRGVMPIQDTVHASFSLGINEWQGRRTLQFMIKHLQDPDLAYSLEMAEKEKNLPKEFIGAAKEQSSGVSLLEMNNNPSSF